MVVEGEPLDPQDLVHLDKLQNLAGLVVPVVDGLDADAEVGIRHRAVGPVAHIQLVGDPRPRLLVNDPSRHDTDRLGDVVHQQRAVDEAGAEPILVLALFMDWLAVDKGAFFSIKPERGMVCNREAPQGPDCHLSNSIPQDYIVRRKGFQKVPVSHAVHEQSFP